MRSIYGNRDIQFSKTLAACNENPLSDLKLQPPAKTQSVVLWQGKGLKELENIAKDGLSGLAYGTLFGAAAGIKPLSMPTWGQEICAASICLLRLPGFTLNTFLQLKALRANQNALNTLIYPNRPNLALIQHKCEWLGQASKMLPLIAKVLTYKEEGEDVKLQLQNMVKGQEVFASYEVLKQINDILALMEQQNLPVEDIKASLDKVMATEDLPSIKVQNALELLFEGIEKKGISAQNLKAIFTATTQALQTELASQPRNIACLAIWETIRGLENASEMLPLIEKALTYKEEGKDIKLQLQKMVKGQEAFAAYEVLKQINGTLALMEQQNLPVEDIKASLDKATATEDLPSIKLQNALELLFKAVEEKPLPAKQITPLFKATADKLEQELNNLRQQASQNDDDISKQHQAACFKIRRKRQEKQKEIEGQKTVFKQESLSFLTQTAMGTLGLVAVAEGINMLAPNNGTIATFAALGMAESISRGFAARHVVPRLPSAEHMIKATKSFFTRIAEPASASKKDLVVKDMLTGGAFGALSAARSELQALTSKHTNLSYWQSFLALPWRLQ